MAQLQIEAKTNQNQIQISIKYPKNPEMAHNFTLIITILEQQVATRTESIVYKKQFHTQHKQIFVQDLKYSSMYKVAITWKFGITTNLGEGSKNIFVYTQALKQEPNEDQVQEVEQISNNEYEDRRASRNYSVQQNRRQLGNINYRNQASKVNINKKSEAKRGPKPKNNNNQLCNSQLLIKTIAQSNHIVNKDKAHRFLLQSRKCRNVAQFINQKHGKRINRQEVSDKRMLVIQSKLLFHEIYKYREGCKFFSNNWCMGPFYSYDFNQKQIRKQ